MTFVLSLLLRAARRPGLEGGPYCNYPEQMVVVMGVCALPTAMSDLIEDLSLS